MPARSAACHKIEDRPATEGVSLDVTGRARDHYESRRGPLGPDGLSRLRLGSAVAGEVEKGVTDYDQIAANIAALYDPAWLERELGRHYRSRYMTRMVERIAGCLEGRSEVAA